MVLGTYWGLGAYCLQIRRNRCAWNKPKNYLTHPRPCILALLLWRGWNRCAAFPLSSLLFQWHCYAQSPGPKSLKSLNHPVMSSAVLHTSVLTHVLPLFLESFFVKILFILQNPTHASLTPWNLSNHSFLCASCAHQLSHWWQQKITEQPQAKLIFTSTQRYDKTDC